MRRIKEFPDFTTWNAMRGMKPRPRTFFIIWSPQSGQPPRIVYATQAKADQVAKEMATRYQPQTFIVMKAVTSFAIEPPKPIAPKFVKETFR